jgi:hypothetical protein
MARRYEALIELALGATPCRQEKAGGCGASFKEAPSTVPPATKHQAPDNDHLIYMGSCTCSRKSTGHFRGRELWSIGLCPLSFGLPSLALCSELLWSSSGMTWLWFLYGAV